MLECFLSPRLKVRVCEHIATQSRLRCSDRCASRAATMSVIGSLNLQGFEIAIVEPRVRYHSNRFAFVVFYVSNPDRRVSTVFCDDATHFFQQTPFLRGAKEGLVAVVNSA